uniref:Retrovirus-related Pol polyprotein from transposon 17.6 n=1 Tax=Cajanus cajan TaxID=3821 RepID=A0A151R093_CAJCA|nr:Retrovirus-related Pol polyprotein from transposon 17.6 [Cajanus cajan]
MMYPPDEVHTSFIIDHANYCYRVMPFGLKNAGATYQWLMDKVFHQQIGRNMEVYVDDMVVKTTSVEGHVVDLAEVFGWIRKHNMRLNPEKCVFGI